MEKANFSGLMGPVMRENGTKTISRGLAPVSGRMRDVIKANGRIIICME